MKYAVVYYPNGSESKYVGSISDYQDGGVADPVLMSQSEADELMADLTEYVKNEYIGKNDADNEQAHYAFEQGQWGFDIEEFDLEDETAAVQMKYVIRDREAGNEIERFATREEAEKQLAVYEEQDRADGTYEENFYEIKCPEAVSPSFSVSDLNVWTNKGQACEVSVEIKDVTAVFVMWDWYDYNEEKRQFALQQLCTILNLGGTFDETERHMRMNGIDCELKELQHD